MARAKYLEEPPEGAPDIEEAHQEAAAAGDTAPPEDLENVNLHFVAFVHKEGAQPQPNMAVLMMMMMMRRRRRRRRRKRGG